MKGRKWKATVTIFFVIKMKICYIASARIPTERAHGLQMMKMCESFALEGNEVVMFAPKRFNPIKQDPFDYYNVQKVFSIIYLPCVDFVRFGRVGFLLTTWLFAFQCLAKILKGNFDWIYSRDGRSLWVLSWFDIKFGWNIHDDQRKWWAKRVLKKAQIIVMTNRALVALHKDFVGSDIPATVVPNGVNLEEFGGQVVETMKRDLSLSDNKKIILYTGHLYPWKGVHTLAEAAKLMPEEAFVFIGGTERDIIDFKKKYSSTKNIFILGHRPHSEIANYLRTADLLVLPNSAKDVFSSLYTSPIKLFEYMMSGTPIMASDLPSIREILDDRTAYFFTPDDHEDFARVTRFVLRDMDKAKDKARKLLEDSELLSWRNRGRQVLAFLNKQINLSGLPK